MELEIYRALIKINVPADDAQAVADSINQAIDKRYSLHSAQLSTKGDLAELETRLTKSIQTMQQWTIMALIASGGLFAAISKLLH